MSTTTIELNILCRNNFQIENWEKLCSVNELDSRWCSLALTDHGDRFPFPLHLSVRTANFTTITTSTQIFNSNQFIRIFRISIQFYHSFCLPTYCRIFLLFTHLMWNFQEIYFDVCYVNGWWVQYCCCLAEKATMCNITEDR